MTSDRAAVILQTIEENPGIHFREIMRKTGLMNGVLAHYLAKLEDSQKIVALRQPRTARFYSSSVSEDDYAVIRALRRPTPRALILALLSKDGQSFQQLVDVVERSPPTISLYMTKLVKEGTVQVRLTNLKKHYWLTDRKRVERLLDDHGPGLMGKYTSNFEDMINPLGM